MRHKHLNNKIQYCITVFYLFNYRETFQNSIYYAYKLEHQFLSIIIRPSLQSQTKIPDNNKNRGVFSVRQRAFSNTHAAREKISIQFHRNTKDLLAVNVRVAHRPLTIRATK